MWGCGGGRSRRAGPGLRHGVGGQDLLQDAVGCGGLLGVFDGAGVGVMLAQERAVGTADVRYVRIGEQPQDGERSVGCVLIAVAQSRDWWCCPGVRRCASRGPGRRAAGTTSEEGCPVRPAKMVRRQGAGVAQYA